jgi:TamB, inner membrane protein subunit of TAM complex
MPVPDATPPAKQKPQRGWIRRAVRWLGVILLIVAIFHRPLFDHGVRFLVIQIAAREHLSVDLHLSGSIFTNLTVTGVRVSPTGTAPNLVKGIKIDRLHLDYSIPSLLRHGIGQLLQSYEIVNATIDLVALPSKSEPERQQKNDIAETLNNILGQPAFYADRVRIENFNLILHSESNVTVIKNFNLTLDPEQPGALVAERLEIPGVPVWRNLHAETSYAGRNLFIRRLELSPELVLEEFNFDASQHAQNKAGMQLKARLFGGTLSFSIAGTQVAKKAAGKLPQSYDTILKLSVSDVSLESAAAYFGAPKPPVAKLAGLSLVFTGDPEKPRTWKGNLSAEVDTIALDKTMIDSVGVKFEAQNGKADLTAANVVAGKNSVGLTAQIALPESVTDFPSSDVDATLQISAPDLPALTAMLPEPLSGTITGGGPIRLHGGKVNADLAIDLNQLMSGKIGLASAKLRVMADKRIAPAPAKPLDELSSHVTAELTDFHAQDFTIDSAKLDVENHNDLVTLHSLEVHRAENSITAHGSYRAPADFKNAATSPLDAQFAIRVPKLETFGIVANGHALSGHLDGDGELKTAANILGGDIRINGGDFRLADFQAGPLTVGVRIADNLATIEECSLKLRDSDQITVTGKAGIQSPFAYQAGLLIDIANLGALQPLLAAFNVKQSVGGALHIEWNGRGEATAPAAAARRATTHQTLAHSGRLGIDLTKIKSDKTTLSESHISGIYSAIQPEKPRTWKVDFAAKVDSIVLEKTKIDSVAVGLAVENGKADLTAANVIAGRNSVSLTAHLALPESVHEFLRSDADASLQIAAPDLPRLTAMLPEPMTGALTGGGPIRLHGGKVDTDLAFEVSRLVSGKMGLASAKLRVTADKRLDPAPANPLDELNSHVTAELANLHAQGVAIDSAKLDIENQGALISLHTLEVSRADNTISAHGSYRVPPDLKDAANSPVDAQFAIQAPKLESFGIVANGHPLSGHLDAQGELKMAGKMLDGNIRLSGGNFRLAEFQTGPLSVAVRIANDRATIDEFSLKLHGSDQIALTGTAGVQPPFAYEASLLIDIANLSAFQPVLNALDVKHTVAGALHIDWNGKGDGVASAAPAPTTRAVPPGASVETLAHSGRLGLALTKAKVDKIDLSEIRLSGIYGADFAEFKEIRFVLGSTSLTSELALRDGRLKLDNIHLEQAGASVLNGAVSIPLDLKNTAEPIAFDQPISVKIEADKLDIDRLLASVGQTPPASGVLAASFTAEGTLQEPTAELKFSGRLLKAKAAAQMDPADFDLDLTYRLKQLALQAEIRQRQLQPLTIRGRAPLDLAAVIKQHAIDPRMPIEASVRLPPTSLAVISKFTPLVRRITGTAGVDMSVGGTVEKPELSGSAAIELKDVRMTDENIPALDSFHAKLLFANDTLSFDTFEGDLGGGKFKLGGNVRLAKLTDPIFDLRLESKEVLVKRDDSITIRADTDVKLEGPLNAASVGGTIYVTHSRFFKEIDILPIALPGKAKPAPRTAASGPINVSIPNPPLRDWKFDLAIQTRKDDPFLVRGNLANGKAEIDLHLGGTGLAPTLEGNVHIPEFNATLPFSTLKISRGFVNFTKDAPFQPSLDIQADSQIRDYLIHAYIYGQATDPQVTLTAEPPLQYSDIVALIATGSTTSEIGTNADVLASRAAMLAIQQLYRKIFHRGKGPSDAKNTPSLLDRFQIQLGQIDPRTGQQQVTSKLKLTDKFYVLGDLGLGGQFAGQLKYLIRFR